MKIYSITNQQYFKQNSSNIEKNKVEEQVQAEKSVENKKDFPLAKAGLYTVFGLLGAGLGAFHGIYKNITDTKEQIEVLKKPAGPNKIRLLMKEIVDPKKKLKLAVRLRLQDGHHKPNNGPDWRILKDEISCVVDATDRILELVGQIEPGDKPKRVPIIKLENYSYFQKIIDLGETNFLEKLGNNRLLKKPIDFYNKSDGLLYKIRTVKNKNLYYDKQLALKGMVACGVAALLLLFGADMLTNKIKKNKQVKK